ncbi:DUF3159 domain-containing protein [Pseudonocardia sp.]|uniref:DUF3159 domain-containing protein n=1 Tax=Pseudonocardia sp. TaxID=60912 RepID=UPI002607A22A|nr:DUF3159 domain-containing protein [Pseudonocardia sp.]
MEDGRGSYGSGRGREPDTPTVEAEVRAQLVARLGGARAAVESAIPLVVFTLVFVIGRQLTWALAASLATAAAVLLVRVLRREPVRPALQGAVGVGIGALLASATGDAENVFLPGILTAAGWTVLLGGSLLVRRPVGGYLVAELIGERDWRSDPAIMRLGNRLTAVAVAPMVLRLLVQVPLYLSGAVGWLGVARVVMGWPLHVATLAAAAAVLGRGRTPLRRGRDDPEERS